MYSNRSREFKPIHRPLPRNVAFRQLDLLKDFSHELKPGTFDVIHGRFLFIHVSAVATCPELY